MQGIGPGSILGGRYTAGRRTAEYAGAERWTARDTTLDRAVVLLIVPRSHPNVDAVLDAARRSAGLDNPRLSRILDVGTDDDVAYVVEEALEESHSLAVLLRASPLPAPEVRRIAGEAALVLDLARHRGLHHQRLTPDLVLRTSDGDVKVRGLATMAALVGEDDVDDQTAARADAMAVVALAYAGFTGHWPLDGDSGGLPPAPRVADHVAAPSEIAVGVPADLDALCRLTFANDQGPVTPGDFARQIAPWSPIPVLLPTLDAPDRSDVAQSRAWSSRAPRPGGSGATPPVAGRGPAARDIAAAEDEPGAEGQNSGRDAAAQRAPRTQAAGAVGSGARASGAPGTTDTEATDTEATDTEATDTEATDTEATDTETTDTETTGAQQPPSESAEGRGTAAEDRAGAPVPRRAGTTRPQQRPEGAAASAGGTVPVARRVPAGTQARPGTDSAATAGAVSKAGAAPIRNAPSAPATPVKPPGPSQLAAMTAATTAALGSAGAATVGAAKSVSGRISGWSTSTRDRAQVVVEDRRARREESTAARSAQAAQAEKAQIAARAEDGGSNPMGSVGTGTRARDRGALEPPVPLLPPSAAEPLTRDQSRLAIGIIVGFLVLALVLAMWGLSRVPSLPDLASGDGATPTATETGTADATETATEPEPEGEGTPDAPAAGAPLTFTAATDYDPLGDGAESPEELPNILDGDDTTSWSSEGYRSASFSGLKTGVGVVLDLGETTSVSEVTLVLPSESTGTIHVTDDEGYAADADPLPDDLAAAGSFQGSDTVTIPLTEGTSGRYVIVWFTEISTGGEQWYRARLAGATATS